MSSLKLEIKSDPVSWGRARVSPKTGNFITPSKTRFYEHLVGTVANIQMKKQGWKKAEAPHPVKMNIVFFLEMPKSWSKKKRDEMSGNFCTKNRDIDNMIKAVLDGLNKSNVFDDDRQVAIVTASKHWAEEGSAIIKIERT